jgi:hypothetical protein
MFLYTSRMEIITLNGAVAYSVEANNLQLRIVNKHKYQAARIRFMNKTAKKGKPACVKEVMLTDDGIFEFPQTANSFCLDLIPQGNSSMILTTPYYALNRA